MQSREWESTNGPTCRPASVYVWLNPWAWLPWKVIGGLAISFYQRYNAFTQAYPRHNFDPPQGSTCAEWEAPIQTLSHVDGESVHRMMRHRRAMGLGANKWTYLTVGDHVGFKFKMYWVNTRKMDLIKMDLITILLMSKTPTG